MNNVLIAISTISGIYLFFSLALTTRNFGSAIIFKVIPFFLGLGSLFVAGKLSGVI